MAAYFVRRMVRGIVLLFGASFMMFTIVSYMPGSLWWQLNVPCDCVDRGVPQSTIRFLEHATKIDRPWPLSYLAWLFDPSVNAGIVTGDAGPSITLSRRTPVGDLIGPGVGEMFSALLALIAILMLAVVVKRWGRPPAYMAHVYTVPHPTEANFTTGGYLRV